MEQHKLPSTEPWLRGTLTDVPTIPRAVLHALELAKEDLHRWAGNLSYDELHQRPFGIASVAFHLRHISRSLDRLLSYAEGHPLTPRQFLLLNTEQASNGTGEQLFEELFASLDKSALRVRELALADFSAERQVGGKQLPTTLGGLLVHIADHTQRHVGQVITTAKIILANRSKEHPHTRI
jgi:uncharacterized damage-inducible protein DinB